MLKVQTLIINLQGFTDPPVWRAIFFPLFNKGHEILKHSVVEPSDACTISQISHYDILLDKYSFFSVMEDITGILTYISEPRFNVHLPKTITTDNDNNESQQNSSNAGDAYGNDHPQITS